MVKKLLLILTLGTLLLVAGCWWLNSRSAADEGGAYSLTPMEYGRAAEVVSATGAVQPRDVYPVGTELSGRIVEVRADFNQEVAEGELLARLDDQPSRDRLKQAELGIQEAQAGVRQAQAARDAAATAVKREEERSPEVRRQIDLDVARQQLKSAEAAVAMQQAKVQEAEEARRQADDVLRRTEIRAPILAANPAASASTPERGGVGALAADGSSPAQKRTFVVLDRSVSINQVVGPPAAARLFTLAGGMEWMQIEVQVAEADVGRIVRGQTADVKGPGADAGSKFAGRVEEVRLTPISEHGAVFYKAVVEVRNEHDESANAWRLRPGMTADVNILLRMHDPVWKVPASALSYQPDPSEQSEAAKAKLGRLHSMKDHDSWRTVWMLGADRKPWPLFVRTGGTGANGETGVQTAEFSEVLEWDSDIQPPDATNENSYPKLIIAGPPPQRSFFSMPKIKL